MTTPPRPRRSGPRSCSEVTGASLDHLGRYSIDPAAVAGNIENFVGVAQVPIGIAGPLLVDGEHARGEFYVPLATTEGTLVASYNRGMKLLHAAGGVKTTVMDDRMQRAPAFGFDSAREARAFGQWVNGELRRHQARGRGDHPDRASCTTSSSSRPAGTCSSGSTSPPGTPPGRTWRAGPPSGRATGSARTTPGYGTSASSPTWPRTRRARRSISCDPRQAGHRRGDDPGRTLARAVMHTTTGQMFAARQVSNLGGLMAGVNNNGNHSANGITALFVATGQDIANVAESSAALVHTRTARRRRLLLLDHDPGADRRYLRRRHRAAHPARVPRAPRLLRRRPGAQVR